MRALFVCWDGPHQNYLESLFFPVFARASGPELGFDVLQFSFGEALASVAEAARDYGFGYVRQAVSRRFVPVSTAVILALGARKIVTESARFRSTVLFPRSILAAGMCLMARRLGARLPIVLDADGLMADERVDFVGWDAGGARYRILRDIEAQAARAADAVIVRTAAAKAVILARAGAGIPNHKIWVIPNGKDESLFRPPSPEERRETRLGLGVDPCAPLMAYCGSLGPQYCGPEMVLLLRAVAHHRPDVRLLFLTGHVAEAEQLFRDDSVLRRRVVLSRVPPSAVARHLGAADLGLALRRASFSQCAVSPIKVAEYLLCGLPVVSGKGIGDLDQQLGAAGRLIDPASERERLDTAAWFASVVLDASARVSELARQVGLANFTLDQCASGLKKALLSVRSSTSDSTAASRQRVTPSRAGC